MPKKIILPALNFPTLEYGQRETPWDLTYLLFEGGAKANTRIVSREIELGNLGAPIQSRLELVTKIHQVIVDRLAGGGSQAAASNMIRWIRMMICWGEESNYSIELDSVQNLYLAWCDSLLNRHYIQKNLSLRSAYTLGAQAGSVLDQLLERTFPIVSMTRLRMPSSRKTARGVKAEKQQLSDAFAFGKLLIDICDALTMQAVLLEPLPVQIPLRDGRLLEEWSGLKGWREMKAYLLIAKDRGVDLEKAGIPRRRVAGFRKFSSEGTLKTRYPLANRRIEAELLMFIAQTGMNFAQAHALELRHFRFSSYLNGYQVKDRKARRGGEVLFEIFKEYKPHFERYLEWRRILFPESTQLFPLIRSRGRAKHKHPHFFLRKLCRELGVRFVPPQELRNTRVNWLLFRSGDPELIAEMAQHSKETLLNVYERPSQQRAMNEITRFWTKNDPSLGHVPSVAPGQCDGKRILNKSLPQGALEPDCLRSSGCLWCEHHRDLDSQDYLWSLASFRHLKTIEMSRASPMSEDVKVHPANYVVARISEKLNWFRESNVKRRKWFEEAVARIEEGNYHPDWLVKIQSMEGTL